MKKNRHALVLGAYLASWFLLQLLLQNALLSSTIALLPCAIAAFLLREIPKIAKRKAARKIERELPFALLSMSSEIGFNTDFARVLENASRQDYGLFSKGLREELEKAGNSGASVQEALYSLGGRFESTQLRRALSQLSSAFETGNRKASSENLKKLAQELLARQRIECKEYSARLSVMSLMFISVNAVMPALFNAFVTVGGAFMQVGFTPLQVVLAGALAFPALDIAAMLFIIQSAPESLKAG